MNVNSLFFRAKRPNDDMAFLQKRAPIAGFTTDNLHTFKLQVSGDHVYLEVGEGKPIIFCAGLYGSIYNVSTLGCLLSKRYRFIVPYLPMYEWPLSRCTVPHLGDYLQTFIEDIFLEEVVLIGSSMGGGASLYYALKGISCLKALILCGSSGLSTIPMQKGFFQRKNYSFVKKATQEVFFDPSIPTDDMIKEVFDAIQDYEVVLRSIRFTKSTAKDQLHSRLSEIKIPVLLIWGKQDKITPPETGLLFRGLLPNAELYFVNSCGHVPTQEQPKEVFEVIQQFLQKIEYT